MNNPANPAASPVEGDALATVRRFVTTAELIKTLIGLVVATVLAALAVYNHFAKSSELAELACKVVEQNEINNEMIATSREIQAALKLMKENFEASADRPISTQFMAKEIATTVDKIEISLGNVNKVRIIWQKRAIMKDGKC